MPGRTFPPPSSLPAPTLPAAWRQMMRTLATWGAREAELQEELDRMRAAASAAPRHELALLSRRFQEEATAAAAAHAAEVGKLGGRAAALQASVAAVQDVAQRLVADIGVAAGHLVRLGWRVQVPPPGAAAGLLGGGGSGQVTVEDGGEVATGLCRLAARHFGLLHAAIQDAVRTSPPNTAHNQPPPQPPPPLATSSRAFVNPAKDWEQLGQELKTTITQLLHVEESLESNCTCLLCLEVLRQPTTCVPCGHTYCAACLAQHQHLCVECGDRPPDAVVSVGAFAGVCSKYEYKLSALRAMHNAVVTQKGAGGGT